MSQDTKPKNTVPQLRFPEFKGGAGWDMPAMSDVYDFRSTNSLSRDQLNYDDGSIYNLHYGDIHTKFRTQFRLDDERVPRIIPAVAEELGDRFHLCQEGDIILADASEDLNDVGKAIELISLGGHRVVAGTHTIHATRLDDKPAIGFGGYLFKSAAVRRGIQKEAQGAKVYGISPTRITSVPLPMPQTAAEQRKIADCLGSLDAWIAAEVEALVALRRHKTGLMQQLFPRPGETRPRLRFPEFRKAGSWEEKPLASLLEETKRPIEMDDDQPYNLVTVKRRYGGVIFREQLPGRMIKVKSQFIVEPDDFLVSKRQAVHDACGVVPAELAGSIVSNEYSVLTARPGCNIRFIEYFSQQPALSASFLECSVGIVIEKMLFKLDWWLKLKFPTPDPAEQGRIADCLASLDASIVARGKKLSSLRRHKRGLMQQLFPLADKRTGQPHD